MQNHHVNYWISKNIFQDQIWAHLLGFETHLECLTPSRWSQEGKCYFHSCLVTREGTGFGLKGKAAFYFTYPAGLIRVQLNQTICSRSLRDSMTRLGEESWAGKNENTSSHRGTVSQYHLSKLEGQPISEPSAQTAALCRLNFHQ